MPNVFGTLTDFGLDEMDGLAPRITFRPASPGIAGLNILTTRTVEAVPFDNGYFEVELASTQTIAPATHYVVQLHWTDLDPSRKDRVDTLPWKLFVPPEGGPLGDLLRVAANPALTYTGTEAPSNPQPGTWWLNPDTGDLSEMTMDGVTWTHKANLRGPAGFNALGATESDATVAGYVDGAASATRAAMRRWFVPRSEDAYKMTRADIVPGADNRDAIQAVITAAAASPSVRKVILPPGEITLGRQLLIPANGHNLIIEGQGDDTVIRQITGAVQKALIYAAGTDGAKYPTTMDHAAGIDVLTIPVEVAAGLVRGSILGIECDTLVCGVGSGNQEGSASEIRRVLSVSGTTVVVAGPLKYDYPVAANTVVYQMNPVRGVEVNKMVLTSTDAATIKARGIMFEKAQNVRMKEVRFRNSGGGAFLMDTFDANVYDLEVDSLINYDNPTYLGYGIAVGGRSAHVNIDGIRGRDCRHVFTTLADERTVGGVTKQVGGPRHVTVRGGSGEQKRTGTMYSIWDTHPYGWDIVFDHCRAFGGAGPSSSGFQIRNKGTRLLYPVAMRSGNMGIRASDAWASDLEIVGGEVAYAGAGGISLPANSSVRGTYIHDNTQAGVMLNNGSSNAQVANNRIENNLYGIHDQSTGGHTGVVVRDNTIPKSAKQSLAIVSPKSDMAYVYNVTRGYGAGNTGTGGTAAPATVKNVGNITD